MRLMSCWFALACLVGVFVLVQQSAAREPDHVIDIWPSTAPGETTMKLGTTLPTRQNEDPPATRVKDITRPQLHVFLPPEQTRTDTAILIFPGGGYSYVVTDKEGSEAADWLNSIGISVFVVHYRTKLPPNIKRQDNNLPPHSERPVQDGQRAISLLRARASEWNLNSDSIGVIGFSAGGQAAALVTTRHETRAYKPIDEIDKVSCRPDFSMLVYPWRLTNSESNKLINQIVINKRTPSTFLVHAHNDSATSMSSILFYSELRKHKVPAELHIYETGGHGYGMRPVKNSDVDTWPARGTDWLIRHGLGRRKSGR